MSDAEGTKRPRLLVVDDDRVFCDIVNTWLQPRYDLAFAHDGEEALRLARDERPDLVLLDIMMPKLSGYSVAWVFRNDPRYKGIPVIFMTAHAASISDERLSKASAALLKPFAFEHLSQILSEHLPEALLDLGLPVPEVPVDDVPGAEQRLIPRAPVRIEGSMAAEGTDASMVILSLSLRGAYVECELDVAAGALALMTFGSGEAAFQGRCEVLYTGLRDGRRGMGVQFRELSPADELALSRSLG